MYAKIKNGVVEKYPYTFDDLRQDNPQTSFPTGPNAQTLAEFGMVHVVVGGQPLVDHTQNLAEETPTYSSDRDRWEQVWTVSAATADEILQRTEAKAASVRSDRDRRLSACDWTQLDDTPTGSAKKLEWAVYRQALRDIPSQEGFPFSINWPVTP